MPLKLIQRDSVEVVALADAKKHLRVDGVDEDDLIRGLAAAARDRLDGRDGVLGIALTTQTWELTLDGFPCDYTKPILLPLPPLQSVTSVKYFDTAAVEQTWDPSLYQVDAVQWPARIQPVFGAFWPITQYGRINAVTVRFVAGFGPGAGDVPLPIVQAMKLMIGHWYQNRELAVPGAGMTELPLAAEALLAPFRLYRAAC